MHELDPVHQVNQKDVRAKDDCRRLDFVFGRFFWATWSDVGRPYGDIWARIVQNRIEKLVQVSTKDSFKKLDNRERRLTNTPKMAGWVGDAK